MGPTSRIEQPVRGGKRRRLLYICRDDKVSNLSSPKPCTSQVAVIVVNPLLALPRFKQKHKQMFERKKVICFVLSPLENVPDSVALAGGPPEGMPTYANPENFVFE